MTGRPHVQVEIRKRFSGRVATIAITPRKGDVIGYVHSRLEEDTNPGAMNSRLEVDILRKIFPKCIWKRRHPGSCLKLFTDRYMSRFLQVSLNIDTNLQ